MSGQCGALLGRQHLIDIGEKLRQSLGGLVGQLQVRNARSFQSCPIDRVLGQCLNSLRMSGLQLRVHRQQVAHSLLHQWGDLRLLCIRGVNLNVQMLQYMIDMGGDIGGAMRTTHHAVMKAAGAHSSRGNRDDAAGERSSGDKGDEGHAAESGSTRRRGIAGFGGSSHRGTYK